MSLQVWLPLNGNLTNQGVFEFSVSNSGATSVSGGKVTSSCYSFDGSDDAILIPFNSCITEDWSISVWFYKTSIGSKGYQTIFGGPGGFEIEARNNSESDPIILAYSWGKGSFSYEFNKWNHLIVTRNSSETKWYLNGEYKFTGSAGTLPAGDYYLGSWRDTVSQNFEGKMNDFRLYNHCLSLKEIKELSKGLCLHYKLNNSERSRNLSTEASLIPYPSYGGGSGWGQYSITTDGESRRMTCTSAGVAGRYWAPFSNDQRDTSTIYTWSMYMRANRSLSGVIVGLEGGLTQGCNLTQEWQKYQMTGYLANDTYNAFVIYPYSATVEGDWIEFKMLKVEANSFATNWTPCSADSMPQDNTEYDVSGFSNNGELVGNVKILNESPRYNYSTHFNQSGYFRNNNFNLTMAQETISFWIKIPQTTNSQHFCFGTFNSWTSNGIGMWRDSGLSYAILIRSNGESSYNDFGTLYLEADTWTHVVFVYTGTKAITYKNGELSNEKTYGSNGTISNPVIYLGNSLFNGCPSSETDQCQLSDFRIYATALSAEDIKELYHTPIAITNTGVLLTQGEVIES